MNFNFSTKLNKIEDIQTSFLDLNYPDDWKNANFGTNFAESKIGQAVNFEHLNQLIVPCRNLVDLGGKRWRPLFMVLCCELFTSDLDKIELAYKMTPLVEMVHTASLIHDDIEDGADTRRGKPCVHITYGVDTAINAASWLYFSAFSAIERYIDNAELKNQFYSLLSNHLRRLHLGQAMDIYWHGNPEVVPTRNEYSSMVRMKTGTLAALAGQAGVLCALGGKNGTSDENSTKEALEKIAETSVEIGEGFQILDDIINITTGNKGKKRGDDIVEGKKSLPLILHLEKNPQDKNALLECFERASKEGIESPGVEKAISILSGSDCIAQSQVYARNLINNACSRIKTLSEGDGSQQAALAIEQLFTSMLGN